MKIYGYRKTHPTSENIYEQFSKSRIAGKSLLDESKFFSVKKEHSMDITSRLR